MDEAVEGGGVSGRRRYWTVAEKRQIVEEALTPGISVAALARQRGVNANQLFYWRKLYRAGQLGGEMRLLPVHVADEEGGTTTEANLQLATKPAPSGLKTTSKSTISMNIEFPGRALISLEGAIDVQIVRAVLESLRA